MYLKSDMVFIFDNVFLPFHSKLLLAVAANNGFKEKIPFDRIPLIVFLNFYNKSHVVKHVAIYSSKSIFQNGSDSYYIQTHPKPLSSYLFFLTLFRGRCLVSPKLQMFLIVRCLSGPKELALQNFV